MKKKLLKKLRSKAGESIAETLVATLIAALALVMLAGAIGSASNIITGSRKAMQAYQGASGEETTIKGDWEKKAKDALDPGT